MKKIFASILFFAILQTHIQAQAKTPPKKAPSKASTKFQAHAQAIKVQANAAQTIANQTLGDKGSNFSQKTIVDFRVNQASYNNWQAGGENNFSGNFGLDYYSNYAKNDLILDTKFLFKYGINKVSGSKLNKTDDLLEFNSVLGKHMVDYWYYSGFTNFKTQLGKGNKKTDKDSSAFSPAYLQLGVGFLWKKSNDFYINFAALTVESTFVKNQLTKNSSAFGVAQGKTNNNEIGFAITGYNKSELAKNINLENTLKLYSNYSDKFQNVVVDYQINLMFTINKLFYTNLSFQTIYNKDAYKGWQTKQTMGIGIRYQF